MCQSIGISIYKNKNRGVQKKMKRNNGLKKLLIVMAAILVVAVIFIIYGVNELNEYKVYSDALQAELDNNTRLVYVAKDNGIKAGETLEDGVNVMKQSVLTVLPSDFYIGVDDLGTQALIDIEAETPIMKSMVSNFAVESDTREYELSVVSLMTDQEENDFVDVRILFPNGEDYLVLSKKQVCDLNFEYCVFNTFMSEEEILRMSSAIIDAYTVSGTRIYCTRYVEPALQEEATPTYLVRNELIDLINSSPNVISIAKHTLNVIARNDLEARLSALTEEQLSAVVAGNDLVDTAKNSVLLQKEQEDMYADDYYETVEDMEE